MGIYNYLAVTTFILAISSSTATQTTAQNQGNPPFAQSKKNIPQKPAFKCPDKTAPDDCLSLDFQERDLNLQGF